jgi:hypothetical protein
VEPRIGRPTQASSNTHLTTPIAAKPEFISTKKFSSSKKYGASGTVQRLGRPRDWQYNKQAKRQWLYMSSQEQETEHDLIVFATRMEWYILSLKTQVLILGAIII